MLVVGGEMKEINKKLFLLVLIVSNALNLGTRYGEGAVNSVPAANPRGLGYNDPGVQLNRTREYLERERVARQIAEDKARRHQQVEDKSGEGQDQVEADLKFPVKEIKVGPSQVLADKEIKTITTGYIGQEVTLKDLYALVEKINKLDIKDITAGSVIHVDATKISLDGVKQRPGNDNMLLIDLLNPDREKPLDDLVVNFDPSINGIIFDHLWVNNAQINVPTGNLYINKLSVGNKGVFTSNGMTTTVYRGKPIRDGSDSIYWYDTKAHNPLGNLDGWYDLEYTGEGQGWMHLYFGLDGLQQVSNGVLLNLHDYYKVYNQRYTGVDYSLQQLDTKDYLEYRRPFNNSIGYYHRYDLYDWQEE